MKIGSIYAVLFVLAIMLTTSLAHSAEAGKLEIGKSSTMREILVDKAGKRVALRLVSGQEVEGTVTMVGDSLVHISTLAGMEYFDAVVSIDKIAAIRIRVRER